MARVSIELGSTNMSVKIGEKIYGIRIDEHGIFINSNDCLDIKEKSETNNWILIK